MPAVDSESRVSQSVVFYFPLTQEQVGRRVLDFSVLVCIDCLVQVDSLGGFEDWVGKLWYRVSD